MKAENYITIQGWMRTELDLSGNELILYALIYGFSQTEGQKFTGGLRYAAEWLGCSKPTLISALKSLIQKGLITKIDRIVNGVKFCDYVANPEVVKKFNWGERNFTEGGKETLPTQLKNLTEGGKEILPNNKELNIKANNTLINNLIPSIEEVQQRVQVMKAEAKEHYERMQRVR